MPRMIISCFFFFFLLTSNIIVRHLLQHIYKTFIFTYWNTNIRTAITIGASKYYTSCKKEICHTWSDGYTCIFLSNKINGFQQMCKLTQSVTSLSKQSFYIKCCTCYVQQALLHSVRCLIFC